MCGIAGFLNDRNDELLHQMIDTLHHRGPDEEGTFVNEYCSLGNKRLSIVGLADGQQPFFSQDKSVVTVFNGEIYNHNELRKELSDQGVSFKTNCDTELVPNMFRIYGEHFVDKINGMFAIALLDLASKKFYLYRDRVGEKPLFYTILGKTLIFSSELKSILLNKKVPRSVSEEALGYYFKYKYIPSPLTIYHNMFKLEPATFLCFQNDKLTKTKYWKAPIHAEKQMVDQRRLYELLADSIKLRTECDVSYASLLSGGIDSGLIASLLSHLGTELDTYTISFPESSADEAKYAQATANHIKSNYCQINSQVDNVEIVRNTQKFYDEPYSEGNSFATYLLAKEVGKKHKVLFTGEGADEFLGGYKRYQLPFLPRKLNLKTDQLVSHLDRFSAIQPGFLSKLARFMKIKCSNDYAFFRLYNQIYPPALYEKVFKLKENDDSIFRNIFDKENVSLSDKLLLVDQQIRLADYILVRADRMSMANSVEGRIPFLDHRIMELSWQMQDIQKFGVFNNISGKPILRSIASKVLPQIVIDKGKQGFSAPLNLWFRQYSDFLMGYIFDYQDDIKDIVNLNMLRKMSDLHKAGQRVFGEHLFIIYCYIAWLEESRK